MGILGLEVGLKALLTSQSALDTIGHNVANANTPGYSRQNLEISPSRERLLRGLSIGGGVDADVIRRTTDALLTRRLVTQAGSLSRVSSRLTGMEEVETFLAEPGEFGLSSLMNDFFSSVSTLASAPGELVQRTGVVQSALNMTSQFNQLVGNLSALQSNTANQVAAQVDQVNVLAEQLVRLNQEIQRNESGGVPANDLRDERDLALQKLGELVDVTYHEDAKGSVQVYVSGSMLVGPAHAHELRAASTDNTEFTLTLAGSTREIDVRGGSIGGLLELASEFAPGLQDELDRLAHQLIFEMNKVHSTGVLPSGPFQQVTANYAFEDSDGDGDIRDELLTSAGIPFEIQSGAIHVNVTRASDGAMTTTRIDIDEERTTVGDLIDAIQGVPHLSAGIDSAGRLQVSADEGYGLDFGGRLNPQPDVFGAFGGAEASLTTGPGGPYALADGDTLDLIGSAGAFSVTFAAADFDNIGEASADEIAAALNADPGVLANGMRAVVVGGRVALQTASGGSAQTFEVTGGTALGAFGWTAGTVVTGHDTAVDVAVGGAYSGDSNQTFRLVPASDGTIGTTAGLLVNVVDSDGNTVATLDVGEGYTPGTELAVADGITVRFGYGELSAAHNDTVEILALADGDTSDVLGAIGINALFVGTDAADIALRDDIAADPRLLTASRTGAEGDNRVLLDLIELEGAAFETLGNQSLGGFYGDFVATVGFEVGSTRNALDIDQFLMDNLVERREQVSGVNVDEELVNMIQFEQAYSAAANYIQVVQQTMDELLSLI